MGCAEGVEGLASGRRRAPRVPRHAVWLVKAAKKKSPEDVCPTLPRLPDLAKVPLCSRQRRKRSCCWAASEPMQPTPLLLSAEEGGRVSRTLVSKVHVRWKCPPSAAAVSCRTSLCTARWARRRLLRVRTKRPRADRASEWVHQREQSQKRSAWQVPLAFRASCPTCHAVSC